MDASVFLFISIASPLLVSLVVAMRHHEATPTYATFVLGGRDMPRGHYVATLTASNAALANILFLYVYWGFVYGIWAWMWGSLFWGAGFLLFSRYAREPRFAELTEGSRPECSINEILGTEYSSTKVASVSAVISAVAFLLLLTLELNVGAKIYVGLNSGAATQSPYGFALVIGAVLSMYAAYGGMKAVLKTDFYQLFFILAGSVGLILLVSHVSKPNDLLQLVLLSGRTMPMFEFSWLFVPFVLGSLLSWGLWFLCTMDMWQRTIATQIKRPVLGLKAILPSYGLLIGVTFSGVIVGVYMRSISPGPYPSKFPLVDFLHSAFLLLNSDTVALVLVCFVMAGFTAAMLSTVDTYIVIVSQCIASESRSYANGLPHERISMEPDQDARLRRRVQLFTASIPFLAVAAFYVINVVAHQDTFTLYMIAGSAPFALLPLVLGALHMQDSVKRSAVSDQAANWALLALVLAIGANLWLSGYALGTTNEVAFGLLYFVPAATAFIAGVPFMRRGLM